MCNRENKIYPSDSSIRHALLQYINIWYVVMLSLKCGYLLDFCILVVPLDLVCYLLPLEPFKWLNSIDQCCSLCSYSTYQAKDHKENKVLLGQNWSIPKILNCLKSFVVNSSRTMTQKIICIKFSITLFTP